MDMYTIMDQARTAMMNSLNLTGIQKEELAYRFGALAENVKNYGEIEMAEDAVRLDGILNFLAATGALREIEYENLLELLRDVMDSGIIERSKENDIR